MVVALSIMSTVACGGEDTSYQSTVSSIRSNMEGGTTTVRSESYDYIKFDTCSMEYRVRGIYPSGMPYSIRFSKLDFAQLNLAESKALDDYAAAVMLNFNSPALYDNGEVLPVHTVMVLASDYERAQLLFGLFSRLGRICQSERR
jgi:hypothetical protein